MISAAKGKALLIIMVLTGCAAALTAITEIWFDFFDSQELIKTIASILIIGFLAGLLSAVNYDLPATAHKLILGLSIALIFSMAVLLIVQMWWMPIAWIAFAKIFGTIFILFVLVSFISAVREDFGFTGKLKDDKFVD